MKKAELITDLESKPDVLDTNPPRLVSEDENVKRYDVPVVLDRGNDMVVGASQPIIVIDEGKETEAAYYNSRKVFTEQVTTFRDEVDTRATSFEGVVLDQGTAEERTIVKVTIQQVFENRQAATAVAFCNDGSQIKALLYKDEADNWQTQILTG